jgi:hypothetical protein
VQWGSFNYFLSPLLFSALYWMYCLVCIQSGRQSVSLCLHTDMEQHHHHPVHADHHHPHEVTADPHPPSLSSDSIILVIFLLACLALGLGIKLVVVLLRRFRWVSSWTAAGYVRLMCYFYRKRTEALEFERKYSTVT